MAAIAIAAIGLVAALGWFGAFRFHVFVFEQQLEQNLSMYAPAVRNRIGGFTTIAELLAEDDDIASTLDANAEADRVVLDSVAARLQHHAHNAGAVQIFILDGTGQAVVSSAWVGLRFFPDINLSFRPYFRQAIEYGRGGFNALDITSGEPGYFLSERIAAPSGAQGVLVIQFDLLPGDRPIGGTQTSIALADRAGVVFLSSKPDWQYRPLRALSEDTIRTIEETRQYGEFDLSERAPLLAAGEDGERKLADGNGYLFRMRPIEPLGWTFIVAQPYQAAMTAAHIIAVILTLAGFVVAGLLAIFLQHRELARIRHNQSLSLETQVAERTRELAEEVEIRRETEKSLRDAEEDLVQATKLAALGQMSAALAHEVSQPVTALAATLAAADRRLDAGENSNAGDLVARAQSLTRRIQHIIRHLRSFSKKERGKMDRMVLATSIDAALELAETRAREIGAHLDLRDIDRSVEIMGTPVRLEQVLINVLLNALDAVADREERVVTVGLEADEKTATICVCDTGAGIPDALAERLAEPFFTTKSDGDGIGLGLSISQSILSDFGGSMRFLPREGGGTTCEIRLPLAGRKARSEAAE